MSKILVFLFIINSAFAQNGTVDPSSLELLDQEDAKVLSGKDGASPQGSYDDLDVSKLESIDELESLKSDVGEEVFNEQLEELDIDVGTGTVSGKKGIQVFDVGEEEQKLLSQIDMIKGKISEDDWNGLISKSKSLKYIIKKGDYLWKISQKLFGSGFYYAKIWSLNPQITNPHEVEPGMVLVFETGDENLVPTVKMGEFKETTGKMVKTAMDKIDFSEFGEGVKPNWLEERSKLKSTGVFFQFMSEETYDDFENRAKLKLNTEFQKYVPPETVINLGNNDDQYDEVGFDKGSKLSFNYKEGFYLNTFLSTNIVQDFGFIESMPTEPSMIRPFDKVFVRFDESVDVRPGDKFSVYKPEGLVSHDISDREGYRYTINAQVVARKKVNELWECEITEITGLTRRLDRVTVYTQKIDRIVKNFNERALEVAIIGSYRSGSRNITFGDVVYLDRGRADGLEVGNVFEVFSRIDRGTEKRISKDPAYKLGEMTVITLTDDFATALITNSSSEIKVGQLAFSKSPQEAARLATFKNKNKRRDMTQFEKEGLENLDIEIKLDDLNEELLKKAEKIQLTDDEIEELERQEMEKTLLSDHEKDLRELERLEKEIVEAENKMMESRVDEDKFLEDKNLDELEKDNSVQKSDNEFANLDEIEEEVGKQYLDEDVNVKENPYGLTEFDLEELDELMNTEE